jgi:hypothetical protein
MPNVETTEAWEQLPTSLPERELVRTILERNLPATATLQIGTDKKEDADQVESFDQTPIEKVIADGRRQLGIKQWNWLI